MTGHRHEPQAAHGKQKSPDLYPVTMKSIDAGNAFEHVDFAFRAPWGFSRNNIVRVDEVGPLVGRYRTRDCFSSAFIFDGALVEYVKGNGNSIAGYGGPVYAHFIPIDIDSPDLDRALRTARDLCRFLLDSWGAPEYSVPIWFSGNRGLHLGIASGLFGNVEPGEDLPGVFQAIRRHVVTEARVRYPETVDYGIGDRLRLFRLPNTMHSGRLYKVPLSVGELFSWDADDVRAAAGGPRPVTLTDPTGLLPMYDVSRIAPAEDAYARCTGLVEERRRQALPDPGSFLSRGRLEDCLCPAELRLYEEGVPEGVRSRTALRWASRMRAGGYSENEAAAMVAAWNERNDPPMEHAEARRIVSVAYRADTPYQHGCGTGSGDEPATRLIYEACPYSDRSACATFRRFSEQRETVLGRE